MTVEQVVKLLDNGFTRDDIIGMMGTGETTPKQEPAQEPQQEQEPQKEPQKEPEQKPEPKPEPQQKPEPAVNSETEKRLTSIENNIINLMKAIQDQNLKNDSFGSMEDSLETATDKAMASIIRPEFERSGKK